MSSFEDGYRKGFQDGFKIGQGNVQSPPPIDHWPDKFKWPAYPYVPTPYYMDANTTVMSGGTTSTKVLLNEDSE